MDYKKLIEYRNNDDSGYAKVTGVVTTHISENMARGELKIGKEHLNHQGIVHGGALFTLADTIAGAAAASCFSKMVTLNSNFNFLEAAQNTVKVYAKAQVVRQGGRISVIDVELTDDHNQKIAIGTFTFYNLRIKIEL